MADSYNPYYIELTNAIISYISCTFSCQPITLVQRKLLEAYGLNNIVV